MSTVGQTLETLTVLEYFMARAPQLPQSWFEPVFSEPCPPEVWASADGKTKFTSKEAAEAHCGVQMYRDYRDLNAKAIREWHREREKQRLLQWPRAWAIEVLKTAGRS